MRTFRTLILVLASAVFSARLLYDTWWAVQAGMIEVSLRHYRPDRLIVILQSEQPRYFLLAVTVLAAIALLLLLCAALLTRSLLSDSRNRRRGMAESLLAGLDQSAPSGLAPLGWALLLASVVFVAYVVA